MTTFTGQTSELASTRDWASNAAENVSRGLSSSKNWIAYRSSIFILGKIHLILKPMMTSGFVFKEPGNTNQPTLKTPKPKRKFLKSSKPENSRSSTKHKCTTRESMSQVLTLRRRCLSLKRRLGWLWKSGTFRRQGFRCQISPKYFGCTTICLCQL